MTSSTDHRPRTTPTDLEVRHDGTTEIPIAPVAAVVPAVPRPRTGSGAVRRDRAALRAKTPQQGVPVPAPRPARPALRGRSPMEDRLPLRDRALLRGRAALRHRSGPAEPAPRPPRPSRPARARRFAVRAGAAAVVVLLLAVVLAGLEVRSAQSSLAASYAEAGAVQKQLAAYQWSGTGDGLTRARLHAERARDLTSGRGWRLARHLPLVGDDAAALSGAAASTAALTAAARPLEGALPQLTALGGKSDGTIDLAALRTVVDTLPAVERSARAADAALLRTPTAGLFAPAADGLRGARETTGAARGTATVASPALRLLPDMLGAAGPRTWLVLLTQRSATEGPRTGRLGAWAVVRAQDGRLTVTDSGQRPRVPLARTVAQAGPLARALAGWAGGTADYAVVMDAGSLAALVQATGPVRLGRVDLDGASTERFFGSTVLRITQDPVRIDRAAAGVLGRGLTALTTGRGDLPELLRSLSGPAAAGQVRVAAADRRVAADLAGAGAAPDATTGESGLLARLVTSRARATR